MQEFGAAAATKRAQEPNLIVADRGVPYEFCAK
jgi:hypothetical protein